MSVATAVSARPRGRNAVKVALLQAAARLFAERGPAAVSVRDIAAEAGVNHGLVHRHFGSKEALLGAVLDRLVDEIVDAIPPGKPSLEPLGAIFEATQRGAYWRVLARAILDGEIPEERQSDFPVARQLVATFADLKRQGVLAEEFDPQLLAAGSMAVALGWLAFEPFLLAATGLPKRQRREHRRRLISGMLAVANRMTTADGVVRSRTTARGKERAGR